MTTPDTYTAVVEAEHAATLRTETSATNRAYWTQDAILTAARNALRQAQAERPDSDLDRAHLTVTSHDLTATATLTIPTAGDPTP